MEDGSIDKYKETLMAKGLCTVKRINEGKKVLKLSK
jgi:hypothetical protein